MRELIGDAWMAYLTAEKIPFVLRLRENQYVAREGYETWIVAKIARSVKPGEKMTLKGLCRLGQGDAHNAPAVRLVILRLVSGELLALATSSRPRHARARYRARWRIETLFGNLKTRGFNLEDTHLADPPKLSTLLVLLALAVALAVKTGVAAQRLRPIPVKKTTAARHSRCSPMASTPCAKSWPAPIKAKSSSFWKNFSRQNHLSNH